MGQNRADIGLILARYRLHTGYTARCTSAVKKNKWQKYRQTSNISRK